MPGSFIRRGRLRRSPRSRRLCADALSDSGWSTAQASEIARERQSAGGVLRIESPAGALNRSAGGMALPLFSSLISAQRRKADVTPDPAGSGRALALVPVVLAESPRRPPRRDPGPVVSGCIRAARSPASWGFPRKSKPDTSGDRSQDVSAVASIPTVPAFRACPPQSPSALPVRHAGPIAFRR